ncbi:putative metal-sulfur cluster biosynthetic enzyme [Halovivax ruber XH-70]|uniref:Putative metal-sulfur cluster biosynthetic enzyme n=1 Tax=Halovivax ruber (strain DSM 18193 / JCM 13892 / XH-70) TaxID=797302 RepID=U3GL06_HALRX|nr:1,2-phenylacetyl-CoA epoxidase subunit PaaD [Halovivax ruber]AGB16268.1 putative metal-sulfur cluster biosynthetic enzyme [Halovivax ruber XH-70]
MTSETQPETDATPCGYTEYREGPAIDDLPATGVGATGVDAAVWDALYAVEDPEMPVSIVDLGLIYDVGVDDGLARVDMTLTYSGCPARDMLQNDVREAIQAVDGVEDVDINLVWSPEWSVELVTEAGKENLRDFGLSV